MITIITAMVNKGLADRFVVLFLRKKSIYSIPFDRNEPIFLCARLGRAWERQTNRLAGGGGGEHQLYPFYIVHLRGKLLICVRVERESALDYLDILHVCIIWPRNWPQITIELID